VGTTIIIKMGRARVCGCNPDAAIWLCVRSRVVSQGFRPEPAGGFSGPRAAVWLRGAPAGQRTARLIFNDRLDAAVTGILIVMIWCDSGWSRVGMARGFERARGGPGARGSVCGDSVCSEEQDDGWERGFPFADAVLDIVRATLGRFRGSAYARFLTAGVKSSPT